MKHYRFTLAACYIGYVTQAIVVNFSPLLFLTFRRTFGISLEQITVLVIANFVVQFTTDFLSAKFADKINYRTGMMTAHALAALGLTGLAWLPSVLPAFAGLLLATVMYAAGGGLLEVLVSPIVEACPTKQKSSSMSLLHSFYCWGCVAAIVISVALFRLIGIARWRLIACLWALIPAGNIVLFSRVPIWSVVPEGQKSMTGKELLRKKSFRLIMLLMICSGAAELAVGQWASAFAEDALHVSKTVGDLAGPCLFALLMGISRIIHAKYAYKLDLKRYIAAMSVLCVVGYFLAAVPTAPAVNLLGCAVVGFSTAIMWPGMVSLASQWLPAGGTAMYAMLALGGDIGCTSGPALVGLVSGVFSDDLKIGIGAAVIFPIIMILGICLLNGKYSE